MLEEKGARMPDEQPSFDAGKAFGAHPLSSSLARALSKTHRHPKHQRQPFLGGFGQGRCGRGRREIPQFFSEWLFFCSCARNDERKTKKRRKVKKAKKNGEKRRSEDKRNERKENSLQPHLEQPRSPFKTSQHPSKSLPLTVV